ncbi:MAG: dTMP kinase [Clostridia bacterium]|nr:dTMP kinase [Clostridia bacterium]
MEKKRGKFITLEGPEGSGKSTQGEILFHWLQGKGFDTVLTREPGGTCLGNYIRDILLNQDLAMDSRAEIMLYGADRAQHVEEIIRPALKTGKIVICDRFTDSSISYQGYARGLDIQLIREINSIAAGGLTPDLTILYDLPVKVGLERKSSFDRMEKEGLAFHEDVRKGYLDIARRDTSGRIRVIDALEPIEEVSQMTIHLVDKLLGGY